MVSLATTPTECSWACGEMAGSLLGAALPPTPRAGRMDLNWVSLTSSRRNLAVLALCLAQLPAVLAAPLLALVFVRLPTILVREDLARVAHVFEARLQ